MVWPKKEVVGKNMVRINWQYHKIRQWCVKKYRLWIINWNYIFIIKPISNEGGGKFLDEFFPEIIAADASWKASAIHLNKINIQFRTIIHRMRNSSSNIFQWKFILNGLFADTNWLISCLQEAFEWFSNYRTCSAICVIQLTNFRRNKQ
jgi:hypothetical protein